MGSKYINIIACVANIAGIIGIGFYFKDDWKFVALSFLVLIFGLTSSYFAYKASNNAVIADQYKSERSEQERQTSQCLSCLHDIVHFVRAYRLERRAVTVPVQERVHQIRLTLENLIEQVAQKVSSKTGVEVKGTIKILVKNDLHLFQTVSCRQVPCRSRNNGIEKKSKDPLLPAIQNGPSERKYVYVPDVDDYNLTLNKSLSNVSREIADTIMRVSKERGYYCFIALPLNAGIPLRIDAIRVKQFIGYVGFDTEQRNIFGKNPQIDLIYLNYLGCMTDLISEVASEYLEAMGGKVMGNAENTGDQVAPTTENVGHAA